MRLLLAIALSLAATATWAEPQNSCSNADALGVSRIAEIDTTGGPRFGEQYPGDHLLQAGEVVLTFDDGPFPNDTKAILDALATQCTKATFFNVGSMAAAYPDLAKEVANQGHTIGSHTWSHANLAWLPQGRAIAQIETAFTVEQRLLGGGVAPFFRFPYLSGPKHLVTYLGTRNIAVFSVDVESMDYRARSPNAIVRRVMGELAKRGKGIILFHDIHAVTAKALPTVLSELKAKGFKVVHLVPKTTLTTLPAYDRPAGHVVAANSSAEPHDPPPVHKHALGHKSQTADELVHASLSQADLTVSP
jgi:peptidoglycan-N-acetylglucosamine deacetylase